MAIQSYKIFVTIYPLNTKKVRFHKERTFLYIQEVPLTYSNFEP